MKNKKEYPFLPTFIAAAVSVVVFLPLRVYQYFKIIDPETGFYNVKDFSVYLMYILMAFIVIFNIVTAFINRKKLKFREVSLTPITGAVVYAIAAIGLVVDASLRVTEFLDIYNSYVFNYSQTLLSYISKQGGAILAGETIFAIIAAVYFFALAGGSVSKKQVAPSLKLLALAAPLWAVMRLLFRFKRTISFVNASDLFIELVAIVFMMIFLLAFAQTTSKIDKGESYWKMFAYGIPAAVFSLACFMPRAVLLIIGRGDLICADYSAEICDFTLPIMIFATLMSRVHAGNENKRV